MRDSRRRCGAARSRTSLGGEPDSCAFFSRLSSACSSCAASKRAAVLAAARPRATNCDLRCAAARRTRGHGTGSQPRRGQLREARVAADEAFEVPRALLDRRAAHSAAARAGRAAAARAPECASDAIGASELLSSWLITRITFFHVCTSWRRSSAVRWRSTSSSWRRPLRRKCAAREVVDLLLVVAVADGEQAVAAALERFAQRRRAPRASSASKRLAFELAAVAEQLARGEVGVDDVAASDRPAASPPACSAPSCRAAARAGPAPGAARAARRRARCARRPDRRARRCAAHAQAEREVAVAIAGDACRRARGTATCIGANARAHVRRPAAARARRPRAAAGEPPVREPRATATARARPAERHVAPARPRANRSAASGSGWRRRMAIAVSPRAMPSRSMRRYSACRDRPSSAAACATTPPLRCERGLDRARGRARRPAPRGGRSAPAGRPRSAALMHRRRARAARRAAMRVLQLAHVARPAMRAAARVARVGAEALARRQEVVARAAGCRRGARRAAAARARSR